MRSADRRRRGSSAWELFRTGFVPTQRGSGHRFRDFQRVGGRAFQLPAIPIAHALVTSYTRIVGGHGRELDERCFENRSEGNPEAMTSK